MNEISAYNLFVENHKSSNSVNELSFIPGSNVLFIATAAAVVAAVTSATEYDRNKSTADVV